MTDAREHGAREVIERIARLASSNAHSQGSSSMEMAASVVSYLAAHLDLVPDFMRGIASPSNWPSNWRSGGKLTWRELGDQALSFEEDLRDGHAPGAITESDEIVSWLRRQASEHRLKSNNVNLSLAVRLEYERSTSLIEEIADQIEHRANRQSPGRTIA